MPAECETATGPELIGYLKRYDEVITNIEELTFHIENKIILLSGEYRDTDKPCDHQEKGDHFVSAFGINLDRLNVIKEQLSGVVNRFSDLI